MQNETELEKVKIRNYLISVGTQVVSRVVVNSDTGTKIPAGTVGVVVAKTEVDEALEYRVRFPNGKEGVFHRNELTIRKHFQEATEFGETEEDFNQYVIYRCVVGSRAFGLASEGSDYDRRGFYLPPARLHWALSGVPEQLEYKKSEECYWEIQKFLTMALKANPNVLECLYTPLVEEATPLAQELLAMRQNFLSQMIYQTYNGYVLSQFKKLEQDLRTRGEIRWKHAMHLIRLLLAGVEVLQKGEMTVGVSPQHREKLLALKNGEMVWEKVDDWRKQLHKEFEAAFLVTKLPERPDYVKVNDFLIKTRRSAV